MANKKFTCSCCGTKPEKNSQGFVTPSMLDNFNISSKGTQERLNKIREASGLVSNYLSSSEQCEKIPRIRCSNLINFDIGSELNKINRLNQRDMEILGFNNHSSNTNNFLLQPIVVSPPVQRPVLNTILTNNSSQDSDEDYSHVEIDE